jgi:hypothetical protein
MAKQRHEDSQASSSRNTLIVMSIGALLVAGLVGWALTRTVEAPTTTTAATATQQFPTTTAATDPGAMPAVDNTTPGPAPTGTSAPTNVPLTIPAPNAPIGDKTAVSRIAAEDLRERVTSGAVTVVDVRDANSFAVGHIPGAIHIPYASLEANLDSLPKGKEIVFYCT